jgi:hypothetical protein
LGKKCKRGKNGLSKLQRGVSEKEKKEGLQKIFARKRRILILTFNRQLLLREEWRR